MKPTTNNKEIFRIANREIGAQISKAFIAFSEAATDEGRASAKSAFADAIATRRNLFLNYRNA